MKRKILAFLFALVMIVPGAIFFTACKDDEPKKYVRSLEVAIKNQDILARYDEDNNALQYTYGEKVELAKEDFTVTATYTDGSKGEYIGYDLDFDSGLKASAVTVREHGYDFRFVVEDEVMYTMHVNVNKAKLAKPTLKSGVTYVYSGSEQSIQLDGFNSETMYIDGGVKINANASGEKYTARVNLASTNNFEWEDGTTEPVQIEWSIERKPLAKPTISGNGVYPYTGNPQQPEFSGFDSLTMSYESGTKTEVNNYNAVIVLKDKANYVWADGTDGQAIVAWSIVAQEVAKPTAQTTSFVFNPAQDQSIVLVGFDANKMLIENGTKRNAGEYTAIVSLKNNFKWADGTTAPIEFTWEITKKALDFTPTINTEITDNYVGYYTGEAQRVILNYNQGSGEVVVSGDLEGVDAGTYTVVFSLNTNYTWSDGTEDSITYDWTIAKAKVQKPVNTTQYVRYVAGGQSFIPEDFDASVMNISGNVAENVRVDAYEATISLKNPKNYEWADGEQGNVYVLWYIQKDQLAKPRLAENPSEYYYNYGNEIEAVIADFDAETMIAENNVQTTAGTYFVYVSLRDTVNYEWSDGTTSAHSFSWTIKAITLKKPQVTGTYTYNGEQQTAVINKGFDANIMTIVGGNIQTTAGKYEILVELDDNFIWEGNSTNGGICSVYWEIAPKVVDAYPYSYGGGLSYNGETQSPTIYNFDPEIMNVTGNEYVEAGEYEAVVTLKPNYVWEDDYNGDPVTEYRFSWEIFGLGLSYPYVNGTFVYNGEEQTLIPSNYDEKYMTISNNVQTNAGTYEVVVTLKSESCYWYSNQEARTYTISWTIEESIDLSYLSWNTSTFTYNGQGQAPVIGSNSLEFDYTYFEWDEASQQYVQFITDSEDKKPVNVGKYKVSATLNTTGVSTTGSVSDNEFIIEKCMIYSSSFDLPETTFYFDGTQVVVEFEHDFASNILSLEYSYSDYSNPDPISGNVFNQVGEYIIYATITLLDAENYELSQQTISRGIEIREILVKSVSVQSVGEDAPVVYTYEEFSNLEYLKLGDIITFDAPEYVTITSSSSEGNIRSFTIDDQFFRNNAFSQLHFNYQANQIADANFFDIKLFDVDINGISQEVYLESYNELSYNLNRTDKTLSIDLGNDIFDVFDGYYIYFNKTLVESFPVTVSVEDLMSENRHYLSLIVSDTEIDFNDYLAVRSFLSIYLVYPSAIDSVMATLVNIADNTESQLEISCYRNYYESYCGNSVVTNINVNLKEEYTGYSYKILDQQENEVDYTKNIIGEYLYIYVYNESKELVEKHEFVLRNQYSNMPTLGVVGTEDKLDVNYSDIYTYVSSNPLLLELNFMDPSDSSVVLSNNNLKISIDGNSSVNISSVGGYEYSVRITLTVGEIEYVVFESKLLVNIIDESYATYFESIEYSYNFDGWTSSGGFSAEYIEIFPNEFVMFFEESFISYTMKEGFECEAFELVKYGDLSALKFIIAEIDGGEEHIVYIVFATEYPVNKNTNVSSAVKLDMGDISYSEQLKDLFNGTEDINLANHRSSYIIEVQFENKGVFATLYNHDKTVVLIETKSAGHYTLVFDKAGVYVLEVIATDGSTRDIVFVVTGEFIPLLEATYGDVTLTFDIDKDYEVQGNMQSSIVDKMYAIVGYLGEVELEPEQETISIKLRSSVLNAASFDIEGLFPVITDENDNVVFTIYEDVEGSLFGTAGLKYIRCYSKIAYAGEDDLMDFVLYFILAEKVYDAQFILGSENNKVELNFDLNIDSMYFGDFEIVNDPSFMGIQANASREDLGLAEDATNIDITFKYNKNFEDSACSLLYATDMDTESPTIHFIDNEVLETPVTKSIELVDGEYILFYAILPGYTVTEQDILDDSFELDESSIVPVVIWLV